MRALLLLLALTASANDATFKKHVAPRQLHAELVAAGFKVRHVITSGGRTTVSLENAETKDPAPVVKAHVPQAPKRFIARLTLPSGAVLVEHRGSGWTPADIAFLKAQGYDVKEAK